MRLAIPTILIVDDLAANRTVLATVLGHDGHRLIEAADGLAALAAVRTERPDLVITDVLMPVMDGYEFVRALRDDPEVRGTPVVFYTAHYGQREARALALASGVCEVLTKPADAADVVAVVGRVLRGETDAVPADATLTPPAFDREHLRLVTDKLSEKAGDLRRANARLRALINIGLELASERDLERLLHHVCTASRDLFAATSVTVGILAPDGRTMQRIVTCGADAAGTQAGDPLSGILATVVAERRVVRAERVIGDPVRLLLPRLHEEVEAVLAAPVASAARVHGWICLVGNEGRGFTEEDEQLVTALAGTVGRIYEVEHEIVERQLAEEELRRERDRSQRYLDSADVIFLALDLEGRITLINRKGCELLGWTEQELLGRHWVSTCLPLRIRDEVAATLRNVLEGDRSVVENAVLTRSGEERIIEWRNTLLRGSTGDIIGTFSSGTDRTARYNVIEALRIAEERTRFTLEATGVGIWDSDMRTGVVVCSPLHEALYGLAPGMFRGTLDAVFDRIHPEDRPSVRESVEKATRAGSDFSVSYRVVWPDGTLRWLTGEGRVVLGDDGTALRAVGITQDVTERHMLEQQFRQAQKMDAVGRLAGGIAHDFNNLLTIILGNCELLFAALEPGDQRQADVIEIKKAGGSAAALVRQLLSFSRKEIIQPTRLNLNVIVEDMRVMFDRLIGEDVTVVLTLLPGLPAVIADRGQMEQVVMNLVVNARDAMPNGGTLTIGTANVELGELYIRTHHGVTPGAYVALTVTDTGTGMTPEIQAQLFEPFFTTKAPGKGTGLGLATVHGIVTRAGGSVGVYSEVGAGTSFTVYLPRANGDGVLVAAPAIAPRSSAGTETILIVDDVEGLRELAKRLLQALGYTVLVAGGADEALQLVEQHASIDLVVIDMMMPGTSGAELSRRLVERQPGLKVLYMSGYAQDAMVRRGVLEPGVVFLHKPFTADGLAQKVREALDASPAAGDR